MKLLAYSSTAAFLAHYQVLSNVSGVRGDGNPLSPEEHATLDEMNNLMASLTPKERSILLSDRASAGAKWDSGEERRRRERAELKLHRLLLRDGVLHG
jgi:hypothetical protein